MPYACPGGSWAVPCAAGTALGPQEDPLCRPSARRCPPSPSRETCPVTGSAAGVPRQARESRAAPARPQWMQPGTRPCRVANHKKEKSHQSGKSHQTSKISREVLVYFLTQVHLHAMARSAITPKPGRAPLEGAELSPVCSAALEAGDASTSSSRKCPIFPAASTSCGVLSHVSLTGEMKGSPSSQSARLQGKERVSHHADSISELQAHETWLSKWLSSCQVLPTLHQISKLSCTTTLPILRPSAPFSLNMTVQRGCDGMYYISFPTALPQGIPRDVLP